MRWEVIVHSNARNPIVTAFDAKRVKDLLETADSDSRDRQWFENLENELARALVVAPEAVPGDVVTINSCFRLLDLESAAEYTYTLVLPRHADIDKHKISIMAPVGIAILGKRVGDVIEFKVPGGLRRLKLTRILYQPEAAGDYHL